MNAARTTIGVVAAVAAACCANAGFAQWNSVAYVDSQGRRWRQLDSTCGLTWNQVAAICPTDGVTRSTGTINNQNITGWVWARRDQVQQLLAELGAGVSSPDCSSGPNATGFVFWYFFNTASPENGYFIEGWTSTVSSGRGQANSAFAPSVRFEIDFNSGLTCASASAPRSEANSGRGVWLFRPPCAADINRDGQVGPGDLSLLLNAWGTTGSTSGGASADLDANGIVNAQDLAVMLASWGSDSC